jgi:thiamine kinase-like enzyme
VREARRWLASGEAGGLAQPARHEVFAQADGNLANYLWDGERCCLVDFEDSGVSDRAFEIADLLEHVSVWLAGVIEADAFVEVLDLDAAQRARVRGMRRLFATFWLHMLLPGNRAHRRNPAGSVERQAERTLALLA